MNNCFCCLLTSISKRDLTQLKANESKIYSQLTGNEITKEIKAKICKSCKEKLKSYSEFLKLCKESYEKQFSVIEITVCEQNDDDDEFLSNDDEIPISIIRDQQQQEIIEVLEIEKIEEIPIKEKKYKCKECEKSFTTNQKLQIHELSHSGIKNFSCEQCDKKFATEARMKAHFRVHSHEKPYICDICHTSFAQSNALKCHKRIHTNEKPYVCPYDNCGKRFSQNTILKTHIAAKHDKSSCIECDFEGCLKKFPRKSFLMLHKKRDHENIRSYSCSKCGLTYKQQSHLTRHFESTHLNIRHICKICNKSFSKSWSLKMHQFKHTEVNNFPYKCSECEMAFFERRDKLLKHYKKQHPDKEIKKDPVEINCPVK